MTFIFLILIAYCQFNNDDEFLTKDLTRGCKDVIFNEEVARYISCTDPGNFLRGAPSQEQDWSSLRPGGGGGGGGGGTCLWGF